MDAHVNGHERLFNFTLWQTQIKVEEQHYCCHENDPELTLNNNQFMIYAFMDHCTVDKTVKISCQKYDKKNWILNTVEPV